jgi:membrane protease YdiL (CAAX protease family)
MTSLNTRNIDETQELMPVPSAKAHAALGEFTVHIFLLLALYVFVLGWLPSIKQYLPDDSTFLTVPILVIFGAIVAHFMTTSGYPMHTFGITAMHLGRVTRDAALYTLPLLAIITAIKLSFVNFSAAHASERLFNGRQVFEKLGLVQWLAVVALYCVFTSVQELIVRGGLQSALQLFLSSRRRHLTAIVVSNVLFAVVHMHLSPAFALIVFLPGCYWGWMYRRQHHLAGVTLSHMAVGVWFFFVLGPLQ